MKNKLKNFLLKKRIKILKNQKGFSLIEVLVAVGIIAIISAIAVPQFTANRNQAARVAGDTSIANIIKAFNACRVLKPFDQCNSLSAIGINCPDCHNDPATTNPNKFCAHIKKGGTQDNPDFAACVSIEETASGNTITRTYGGALLQGKICHTKQNAKGQCTGQTEPSAESPVETCSEDTDCGSNQSASDTGADVCYTTYHCQKGGTGLCNSNVCS